MVGVLRAKGCADLPGLARFVNPIWYTSDVYHGSTVASANPKFITDFAVRLCRFEYWVKS